MQRKYMIDEVVLLSSLKTLGFQGVTSGRHRVVSASTDPETSRSLCSSRLLWQLGPCTSCASCWTTAVNARHHAKALKYITILIHARYCTPKSARTSRPFVWLSTSPLPLGEAPGMHQPHVEWPSRLGSHILSFFNSYVIRSEVAFT